VKAATLLLVGENELAPFKRCAELIRRAIPACRRIYLPVLGHLCMLEDARGVHTILEAHWRGARQAGTLHASSGGAIAGSH